MFLNNPALHYARRLTAGLTTAVILFGSGGQALATAPVTLDTVNLDHEKLAHHGGEGTGSAGVLGGAGATSQLATTLQGGVVLQSTHDSLFGNWLLSMAYQRDDYLQKLAKRLGFVNTLTMLSLAGVTGLGLAQSIHSYRSLQPETIDVTEAHGPGGSDHVHIPAESRGPALMGIIGAGVTVTALGTRAVLNSYYKRKIIHRQEVIETQMNDILTRLGNRESSDTLQPELATLVGDQASREFLTLWQLQDPF